MKLTRRRVLGVLAGSAAAIGLPSVWYSRMKTYSGPVSDHFDGLTFFDPDGSPPKKLMQVLRWQLGRRDRAVWPDWAPSPHADTPPPRVEGNKVRFSFVGHASWLIQTAGLNILVDPVWSERVSPFSFAGPKRHNDPGIAFDVCLTSTSCWCRMATTTTSTPRRSRSSPRNFLPVSSRRSAMT